MARSMRTSDGEWTVEVYRQRLTKTWWYRLRHCDSVIEDLSIGSVQRLLQEAGYDMADLVEVDDEPRRDAGAA